MIETLPTYVSALFVFTVVLTLWLFFRVLKNANAEGTRVYSRPVIAGLLIWLGIQAVLTLTGFYKNTSTFPPKFMLTIVPPLITLVILFITKKGRIFLDSLPITHLTILHIVRIPVELVLYWLFLNKAVPELMTFAGRNFDILSGITAPLVYWGLKQGKLSNKILLVWNIVCLALLLNIVVNAILSAPFVFQRFAFDQPNIGILYYPFSWLPAFVVPVVLLSHLAAIRQLLKR
jgi:hypothetical protein